MAAGLPVIASLPLSGESPKIINGYNCGICVEPGSSRALADVILRLYNDKDLRGKLGQAGREAAVKYFSRQIAVAKYEAIFAAVAGNNT